MTVQKKIFPDDADTAQAWIDGASSGNPGPAGAGGIIKRDGKVVGSFSVFLGEQTNNFAEYSALILVLEKAEALGIRSLEVRTDSELLFRQMTGRYKVRNPGILALYEKAISIKRKFKMVRVLHVPREENKEADKLARAARGG